MNKTHLQFQHIRVSTNQVMDEIWIMKTYDKEKDNSFEYWIITIIICAIVIVLALFIFIFVKYKGRKSKTY